MCVVIATKPVHRLQTRPIVHNWRAPLPFPKLHPGPCSNVGMRRWTDRQTDRHTDTQKAVANIHFASAMPHVKLNILYLLDEIYVLLSCFLEDENSASSEIICACVITDIHNGNACTLQHTDGKWCPNMVVARRKGRQECPFPDRPRPSCES